MQDTDPPSSPPRPERGRAALERLRTLALVWGTPDRPVLVVGELLRLPPGPPLDEVPGLLERLDPPARAILDHLAETGADGRWSGGAGPTAELVAARAARAHGRAARAAAVVGPAGARRRRGSAGWTSHRRPPPPSGRSRWSTGPRPAPRSSWYDAPSCSSTGGAPIPRRAEGRRARRTRPARDRDPAARRARRRRAGHRDRGCRGRAARPGHDRRRRRGLAADRRLRRLAARLDRAAVGHPGASLARQPAPRLGGRPAGSATSRSTRSPPTSPRSWLVALRDDVLAELAGLPARRRPGPRHRHRVARRAAALAPAAPAGRPASTRSSPLLAEAAAARDHRAGRDVELRAARWSTARTRRTALEELLPAPVDHVLLQADLTAIAPGPLEQELARQLALVADVESRGGATVYRFAASSVRRAFDAGWSAAEVHDFVASTSRTPVPQSLTYLVDDVSRRFGTLRAGHAESFLRSDDETALTELVHAPGAESLRLRRIAPTVVVSDVPLGTLLPRIRELGLAPVVEAVDGTVRVARPDVFRARSPRRRTPAGAGVAHGSPHRRGGLRDPGRRPLVGRRARSAASPPHADRRDRDAPSGGGGPRAAGDRLRRQRRHRRRADGHARARRGRPGDGVRRAQRLAAVLRAPPHHRGLATRLGPAA